jgi:hypothetical protein
MINLWEYKDANKIKLIDVDDEEFVGYVDEITDSEEYMYDDEEDPKNFEDGITLKIGESLVEFMQSEIKSIEIIE